MYAGGRPLPTSRSRSEIAHNAKISLYPDGRHRLITCTKDIFLPPGWEHFEDKEKVPKPQTKGNEVRDDNVRRAKQKVQDISRLNDFSHFVTWTLDKGVIDRYDQSEVSKRLKKFLNNMAQRRGLKYLVIPEYHKDGAIHMHGLISGDFDFVESGKFTKNGQTIYNMPQWKWGFSTAIQLDGDTARISNYITKYISKDFRKIFGNFYYAGGHGLERTPEQLLIDVDYLEVESPEYSHYGKGYKYAELGGNAERNSQMIMDILGGLQSELVVE